MHIAVKPLRIQTQRFVPWALLLAVLGTLAACSGGGGGGGGGTSGVVTPPPVAAADSYSTGTGQATLTVSSPGVLANDTGTGLTAEIVGSPAHAASFTLNPDGSFTYVHDNTSTGTTDSFTYRATNSGGTSTATVTITITPPVAVADSYGIAAPGGTLTAPGIGVLANDTGTGLTAELISSPAHYSSFTLNPNGSFTYTNDGSAAPTDSFTYRAKVGAIVSNTVTVTININQPPVASNFCAATPAGQTLTVPLSGHVTDPNAGDTVTCALGSLAPLKGTVSNVGGTCTYMPRVNLPSGDGKARGMDKFSIRAVDSQGLQSNEVIVSVLIDGAVRIMPLGDSITQGIYSGGGCDPDGDCPVRSQRIGYRKKLWTDLEALSPNYAVDIIGSLADGSAAGLTPPDDQHEGRPGDCAGPTLNSWCALPDVYNSSITRNLSDNILAWLNTNQADFILLHVGTNGLNFTTPAANASAVDTLLTNIDSWAQSNYPVTVFVARIIPAVNGSLDVNSFNNLVAAIPAAHHPHISVIMVDEQSQLRLTSDPNKADPTYMTAGNNLHPNQTGYNRMADKWQVDMQSSGVLPSCP